MEPTTPVPKVSVVMTTYNSAAWLTRSIESVLSQQAEFPIEIVLGDDCSQDATVEIARAYQQLHPGTIKVLQRPHNVGIQRNYYETFENCRGEYIAWLDADDCWTDNRKIALQAAALDSDPSISVCCHFARRVTPTGEVVRARYPPLAPGRYGLEKILDHNFVPSPSIMFRRAIPFQLPAWYFEITNMSDWPVLVMGALSGDILLMDRVMADYTMNPGSYFEGKGHLFQVTAVAQFLERVDSVLPPQWQRVVHANAGRQYESIAYLLRKQGEFGASRAAAWKAFSIPSLGDNCYSKTKALAVAVVKELGHKAHSAFSREAPPKARS
jgi:glycosyltransferase involved in cell wall biosynthesis